MPASFQVHTWLSATLLYLMNLAAPMGITHATQRSAPTAPGKGIQVPGIV